MNDALSRISELQMRDDYDVKYVVPMFFGKRELDAAGISAIVSAKNQEYSFTSPSGVPHDMIWNTSAVETDEDGVTWLLSIGMDLADIRSMQSEIEIFSRRLSASEGRHNLTMELMDVGLLLIEQGNPRLFPSEKLQAMLGFRGASFSVEDVFMPSVFAEDALLPVLTSAPCLSGMSERPGPSPSEKESLSPAVPVPLSFTSVISLLFFSFLPK